MDLSTVEAHKALAIDAFRRGALADADALYAELEPQYVRHRADDALVGLRFNRLLVALEKGERTLSTALMGQLAEALYASDPPTPMVTEVATRICRLFAEPFPGVDHEATAALVTMAAERARPSAPRDTEAIDLDALPAPDALARLHPGEAAVIVLDLAEGLRGRPGCPAWLRAVQRTFGEPMPLDPRVPPMIRKAARELDADDVFHGYLSLVDAFADAFAARPAIAAELAVGLDWLEGRGLPERLRFTPSLPEERRLALTVEMHGQLASALVGEAGAERLAIAQWRRVSGLADEWSHRVERRRARGGGRAGDAEQDALVSIWRSRAARVLGDLETAATALARNVARARRQAFATPYMAALVLREAADVAERSDDPAGAARLYGEAAQIAAPGCAGAEDPHARRALVEEAIDESVRLALAAEALAGRARTLPEGAVNAVEAERLVETARFVLTLARPRLDLDLCARAVLWVELTAARRGDDAAALRALEAARAIDDRPGVALALLYRGLSAHRDGATADDARQMLETLGSAAVAARSSAAGAVRRAVETAVAVVHQARIDKADPARVEIHLRRAAEAAEGPALADRAGTLDCLLPEAQTFDLEAAIKRLVDEGNAPLARRLCAAARRRDHRIPVSTSPGPAADAVRMALQRRFASRWLDDGPVEPMARIRSRVDGARPASDWSLRTPRTAEARIEFRVFDDWTAVFVVTADGVRLHRWTTSREEIERRVDGVRSRLDDEARFLDAAAAGWRAFIEPLLYDLDGVERLVVAPDGPLTRLPFGLLWGGSFLAEYFDLAIARPAAPPAFATDTPIARPTALIVGDGATTRDLQISTLASAGGLLAVNTRHGDVLQDGDLTASLAGGRLVHLVGAVGPGPAIGLVDEDVPTSAAHIAEALGAGGTVCATIMGPACGSDGAAVVSALLAGVRGGVLARRWAADEERQFLLLFMRQAAGVTDARGLISALGAARRDAIAAHLPPHTWGAYDLFLPEGS